MAPQPKNPTFRDARFLPVDVLLERYLRKEGLLSIWHLALIHKYWFFILDSPTADKLRPYKLHRTRLTIRVVDAAYGAVFRYKQRPMLERINRLDREMNIREIKFEVGPVGQRLGSPELVAPTEQAGNLFTQFRSRVLPKGVSMDDHAAKQIAHSFYATKNDYVDLVLPDGTEVRRHKSDLKQSKRVHPKKRTPKASNKRAALVAQKIQNPVVRQAFINACAAALDPEKT